MDYMTRYVARKREFGSRMEGDKEFVIPAPLGWGYSRPYYPKGGTYPDPKPLPCEVRNYKLTQRFDY